MGQDITTSTLLLLIVIGILATDPWRWMGVVTSGDLNEDSEIIKWVRAVSTAMVAALVFRLLLIAPPGDLAQASLLTRCLSLVISVGAFFALKRNLLLAIALGLIGFVLLQIEL